MASMYAQRFSIPLQRRGFVMRTTSVVAAAALMAALATAVAQTPPPQQEVTIHAQGHVKEARVGTSSSGIPIDQLQLSRAVSYSDLDLRGQAGQDELRDRIRHVARQTCQQLRSLYPVALWTTDYPTCVHDATEDAMAQLPAAVAAAENSVGTAR